METMIVLLVLVIMIVPIPMLVTIPMTIPMFMLVTISMFMLSSWSTGFVLDLKGRFDLSLQVWQHLGPKQLELPRQLRSKGDRELYGDKVE